MHGSGASNGVVLISDEPLARAFVPNGDETHTFTFFSTTDESELRIPDGAVASGDELAGRHVWRGESGPCLALSYPLLGSAVVELTGPRSATVRHCRVPSLASLDWEHVLLSSVVPQTLGLFGELVLHACAIDVRSPGSGDYLGAVLLAGPSMAGKSTIANAALDLGHRVLSDDGVRLISKPDEPGVWLCFPGLAGANGRFHDCSLRNCCCSSGDLRSPDDACARLRRARSCRIARRAHLGSVVRGSIPGRSRPGPRFTDHRPRRRVISDGDACLLG